MIIAIAVLTALLIGFLAGLVSFKKTNEYCGQHGVTRMCPICKPDLQPTEPADVFGRSSSRAGTSVRTS
jgi:hypothetical protein